MPELRDCLREAGFADPRVYLEGYDKRGEGNGVFKRTERAEPCEGFIGYIVSHRPATD